MTDHSPFKQIGEAAANIVDIAQRRMLMRQLEGSVALLDRKAEAKRMEVDRGKALIMKGLDLIRQNDSPDAAIQHLRDTLAAIGGTP